MEQKFCKTIHNAWKNHLSHRNDGEGVYVNLPENGRTIWLSLRLVLAGQTLLVWCDQQVHWLYLVLDVTVAE